MKHAVNLVSKGLIKLKPLITEIITLSNVIEDGFKKMLDGDKEIFRIIVKPD
jgi:threonine dehydrogenase-like Zn-dependent dehydrogenase